MQDTGTLNKKYFELLKSNAEKAQESGDIPHDFVYAHAGKTWVLTLPRSVMAQKRLLNLRAQHLEDPNNFNVETELLGMIAANTMLNNQPVILDNLELGELEVMKMAYMDGLLLPLSLGGDRSLIQYMQAATGQKSGN